MKNQAGEDYAVTITTFDVVIIDLTNSDAVAWIKSIIKKNMIGIGFSDKSDPERTHNLYSVLWAEGNREAIEEAGKSGGMVLHQP